MPIHLHTHAPLAERVLLPGDPGRALRLAKALLEAPTMFNHNRGLWGYTGTARADGALLSIQSTGMGGPSAAIVASELIDLGARRLLRIGTCGGLDPALALGELLILTEAISDDGTSRALGAGDAAAPDAGLQAALLDAGGAGTGAPVRRGPVVSTDLFYDAEDRHAGWRAAGAVAVEMEAATVLTVARRRGAQAACALLVSNLLGAEPAQIDAAALEAAELALGALAVEALTAPG